MQATLTPKQSDDPHDVLVVAPDDVRVAPSDEELSDLLHQAARYRSDTLTQTRDASDFPAGPTAPPFDTAFRPASVNDVLGSGDRRSMAGRAVRAFIALLLAACIGVAAVVWKSYGDVVIKQIAKLTTQVVLTSSLPPEKPALAAQPAVPAVQADAANAASAQPAPLARTAAEAVAPAAAAPSAESARLLQSMARDLASVGQEVEQLKASIAQLNASQQQMSRDIAKTSEARASAQNSRPGISAPPPRSAAARARKPMPPFPSTQAAGAPASPQTAAPYVARQPEPPPQATAQPQADPELASVPRPPMPVLR
jgi:hypothetical protein